MKKLLSLLALLTVTPLLAQVVTEEGSTQVEGVVEFAKTVHDFGDVLLSDGPLSCSFSVKNISSDAIVIYNVVTSCGCTNVSWTRAPIAAGSSGDISATYSNDEGPYPFDKTLTVYISCVSRPVILRLRGNAHKQAEPLTELFPLHFGVLGFKSADVKCGNMEMGGQRSDKFKVANIGKSAVTLGFGDVSQGLSLKAEPMIIPAGSTSVISYTITTQEGKWGKNYYYFTPLADGRATPAVDGEGNKLFSVGIWAFTTENFNSLSKEEKESGPRPVLKESTYHFGTVKAGSMVDATYILSNKGKKPLVIHKADSECAGISAEALPVVSAGNTDSLKLRLDTTGMPKGDTMVVVTLTTNSPLRPIVNIYLSGIIA